MMKKEEDQMINLNLESFGFIEVFWQKDLIVSALLKEHIEMASRKVFHCLLGPGY
jgi:hypothetical protein